MQKEAIKQVSGDVITDASFSENFYGLRRVTGDGTSQASVVAGSSDTSVTDDMHVVRSKVRHLTRAERRWSLFFLVSIMM